MVSPLDQVITVAEAVELSGLNVRMVQRYCKSGKFEARQDHKGNWLILKSSIQPKKEIEMKFKIGTRVDVENSKGASNGIIVNYQEYGDLKIYEVQLPHGFIQSYFEGQIKSSL